MTTTPPGSAPLPEIVVRRLAIVAALDIVCGAGLLAFAITQPGTVDAATIAVVGTFLTIGGTAVGGLSSILASTRSASDPPAPVTVVNAPADPVPTADVPAKRKRGDDGGVVLALLLAVLIFAAIAFLLGTR